MGRQFHAWFAALVAALSLGSMLGGCGGDGSSEADEVRETVKLFTEARDAGEEGEAREALKAFVDAVNSRDAATICKTVTSDQAASFGRQAGGDCEAAMEASLQAADPPRIELLIEDARVRGERAAIDAMIRQGGKPETKLFLLIEEDGEWRLTDPDL